MRVAIYCGRNLMPWGPESLYSGIGGSEEAVIHMARCLGTLGCEVTVYAESDTVDAGVRWVHHRHFEDAPPGDVFIAWRMAEHVRHGAGWRQVYHWLHNRQDDPYPPELAARVDRVLLVSRHHGTDPGFAGLDRGKLHHGANGLDPLFLQDPGNNEPDRAIYASCPARGLLHVLRMWPAIRRAVPSAKLDVYHGFTPVYDAMAVLYPGLVQIRDEVTRRLDQEGVTVHGFVGHDRLACGFARAGVWLYPTETRETSCITAMKALAMGCLPVTSGYAALSETLAGRDLGPRSATRPIGASRWRLWRFRRRAIWAMRHGGSAQMTARRLEWARWARRRYSWSDSARDWLALFRRVQREKRQSSGASLGGAFSSPEP